jgi:hypothetical protein
MSTVKKVWDKTTGYKTIVSGVLLLILQGVKLFWPEVINPNVYQWIQDILLLTGGMGIGDKVRRGINK